MLCVDVVAVAVFFLFHFILWMCICCVKHTSIDQPRNRYLDLILQLDRLKPETFALCLIVAAKSNNNQQANVNSLNRSHSCAAAPSSTEHKWIGRTVANFNCFSSKKRNQWRGWLRKRKRKSDRKSNRESECVTMMMKGSDTLIHNTAHHLKSIF